MADVAISEMSLLETVFGLLCDDKSLYVLLCDGKRSLMMQRVSKELWRLLRAGPCPVYVHVKQRSIMMEREQAWLYVLRALKQLGTCTWARITGLDLEAMGACHDAYVLCDVLVPLVDAHSKWLEVLNLSGTGMSLSSAHTHTHTELLAKCTSLTHLDLSSEFGGVGHEIDHLVWVLPKLTSLQTLILHNSNMGDDGAKKLAEALKKCPTVSFVNVCFNRLSDPGKQAFRTVFLDLDRAVVLHM